MNKESKQLFNESRKTQNMIENFDGRMDLRNQRIVYNTLNAHTRPKNYKIFEMPSMTIPDQSLTIKQIIDRHSKGLSLGSTKTPIYDEENETLGINPKTLDLTDLHDLATENKQRIKNLNATMQKNAEKEAQEAADKALELAIQKRLTEQVKPATNNP